MKLPRRADRRCTPRCWFSNSRADASVFCLSRCFLGVGGGWRHAADGAELALRLSAGVRQRGEAARGGGEDRSSAQTFSLSPEIKVRRHSAGAS